MDSRERIVRAVNFEGTDVIPVAPYMANHGAKAAGFRLKNCYTNPKNLADAQYKAWEIYGQDIIVVQSENYYIAEGFGCKINMPEDGTPSLDIPAIDSIDGVSGLKPLNPEKDGRMSVYIEAMDILRSKVGRSIALRGCGTGPFTLASHLMGTQEFLTELSLLELDGSKEEKRSFEYLLDLCTETLVDFSIHLLEAGADIVQCADSLASLDMISPLLYEKYAYPYERKYFERIKPYCRRCGAFSLLHICGGNTKVYNLYKQLGMDIIEIDSRVDLRFARDVLGNSACIIGNLDPVEIILNGNVDTVERQCEYCIEAAGNKGFILGSGCEVPVGTPRENMEAIIRTARKHKGV